MAEERGHTTARDGTPDENYDHVTLDTRAPSSAIHDDGVVSSPPNRSATKKQEGKSLTTPTSTRNLRPRKTSAAPKAASSRRNRSSPSNRAVRGAVEVVWPALVPVPHRERGVQVRFFSMFSYLVSHVLHRSSCVTVVKETTTSRALASRLTPTSGPWTSRAPLALPVQRSPGKICAAVP